MSAVKFLESKQTFRNIFGMWDYTTKNILYKTDEIKK